MRIMQAISEYVRQLRHLLPDRIGFCCPPAKMPGGSLIFLPLQPTTFHCGLAGVVTYKKKKSTGEAPALSDFFNHLSEMKAQGCAGCRRRGDVFETAYLGGEKPVSAFFTAIRSLKEDRPFFREYRSKTGKTAFADLAEKHRNWRPPNLRQLVPSLPGGLTRLVREMLSKNPWRRPRHAQEVVERLTGLEVATFAQRSSA